MRSILLFLLLPTAAAAQLPPIKLTLDPAPEAKPSLRYELLPNSRDAVPGNAVLHYLRAHASRPAEETDAAKRKAEYETVIRWEDAKPDAIPVKDVAEYLKRYKSMFRELEYGARCKECDWSSAPSSGADAINDTVGGVQSHRELARWLSLRFKLEIAEKRYDDAIRTIQTGLQFGRHVAGGPSMIQMLVGNAIVSIFLARIDTLIEQPDSPNLYWALSTLPKPLVDIRPGLDGEDRLTESFLPGIAELRKGPLSAERALELTSASMKAFQQLTNAGGLVDLGLRLGLTVHAEANQEAARKELIARGRSAREVAAMPAVQAVFLNSFERYRDLADDYRKWFLLGGPDAVIGIEKIAERLKKLKVDSKDDPLTHVLLGLLPAAEKVFFSFARTERRVAQLRALEAIRLHAAASGQLPKELADIKKVPVPNDPMTGKPFVYELVEGGFTLTPNDPKATAHLGHKYEVAMRIK